MSTPVKVTVTGPALDEIHTFAVRAQPCETGGLLLGWWAQPDVITVRHAIEVRDRWATKTSWVRRPTAAQRVLRRSLAELDHPLLGYVGDWHSHPEACLASSRDRDSIAQTSRQYPNPIALIIRLNDYTFDTHIAHAGVVRDGSLFTTNHGGAA